jgi:hypothetical protein
MALITGFGLFIVSVLIAALSRTVAEEIGAWSPSVIRGLIKLAVGRLPEGQRERFDEEWQSHVSEVPGKIGKLLVAAGLLFAAYNMALTDRRNRVLENMSLRLANLDKVHAATTVVVNLIQNDETLPNREDMLPHVNDLSSLLNKSQKLRNRLAASVATVSDAPETLLANLQCAMLASATRLHDDAHSRVTAEIVEKSAQIVKLVGARTQG